MFVADRLRSISRFARWAAAPVLALTLTLAGLTLPALAQDTPPAPHAPSGTVALTDGQAILDRIDLSVANLTPAPEGTVYRVWLRSDEQELAQPLGDLSPDDTGAASLSWGQPAGEPLFINFSQVFVTLDPSAPVTPDAQPGPAVLQATVDPGAITQFRRLLVRWPDSRYGTASLQGLRQVATAAEVHAAILREAAATGDLDGIHRKAEHLVNLMEGSRGAFFGDLDHSGRAEDPGDGVGFLPYSWGALTQSQFAWATAQSEGVAEEALAIQPPVRYALAWAGFVRDAGIELSRAEDLDLAQELSGALSTAVHRVAAAIDPGDDPILLQIAGEHDFSPAYSSGLALLQLPLVPPGATVTAAGPQSVGVAG